MLILTSLDCPDTAAFYTIPSIGPTTEPIALTLLVCGFATVVWNIYPTMTRPRVTRIRHLVIPNA